MENNPTTAEIEALAKRLEADYPVKSTNDLHLAARIARAWVKLERLKPKHHCSWVFIDSGERVTLSSYKSDGHTALAAVEGAT